MIKDQLMQIVGADYVVADDQLAPWTRDWSGVYHYKPLAVVRPANTQQVSQILQLANETGTAVVPVSMKLGLLWSLCRATPVWPEAPRPRDPSSCLWTG